MLFDKSLTSASSTPLKSFNVSSLLNSRLLGTEMPSRSTRARDSLSSTKGTSTASTSHLSRSRTKDIGLAWPKIAAADPPAHLV